MQKDIYDNFVNIADKVNKAFCLLSVIKDSCEQQDLIEQLVAIEYVIDICKDCMEQMESLERQLL